MRPAHKRPLAQRSPRAPAGRRGRSSSCPRLPFCRTLRRAAASKYCRSLLEDVPIEANSRNGVRGYCPFAVPRPGGRYSPGSRLEARTPVRTPGRLSGDDGGPSGRAGSARQQLVRQTAAVSIQYDSGLSQGPAAHSTGRVEVRQKNCRCDRPLAAMIDGGTRGREPHVQHQAARVHHAARRRGSVAARGARAAAGDADDWVSLQRVA